VSDPGVQENADVIFRGEVTRVAESSVWSRWWTGVHTQTVEFTVLDMIKGTRPATILVEMSNWPTSCDLEEPNFKVGEQYLMSAFEVRYSDPARNNGPIKLYYNNYCCLRERLEGEARSAPATLIAIHGLDHVPSVETCRLQVPSDGASVRHG
jgi:hypothetical protein